MKRFLIRLSVVSVIAILGLIAIAQAQRGDVVAEAAAPPQTETPASPTASNTSDLLSAAATERASDAPTTKSRTPVHFASSGSAPPAETPAHNANAADLFNTVRAQSADAPPSGESSTDDASVAGANLPERSTADLYADNRYGNARSTSDRYGRNPSSAPTRDPFSASSSSDSGAAGGAMPNSPPLDASDQGLPAEPTLARPDSAQQPTPATPPAAETGSQPEPASPPTMTAPPQFGSEPLARPAAEARFTDQGGATAAPSSNPFPDRSAIRMPEPAAFPAEPANPLRGVGSNSGMPHGASARPATGQEGTGRPGQQQLEGIQAPSLSIEKFAPAEIQIGKPATFEILIRNVGQTRAQDVTVYDQIPMKTRLLGTTPQAERSPEGDLVWNLGALEPGAEQTVQVEVMPIEEGEVGGVATVHFTALSSARTIATRPELQIEVTAPKETMIGGNAVVVIKVTNPGTGPATGVVLKEIVPENFTHPGGAELEYEVGELKPKESRELELTLTAARAGIATNLLTARGDGSLQAQSQTELEVIAPALAVGMDGPKRRFLEREATYTVSITNPGTAAAREVELVTYLPKGLEFVRADNYGEWDPQTRAVRWSLEELPASETGSVSLTAMPIEAGEHKIIAEGTADKGLTAKQEQAVLIEGVAAILFQVVDVQDPIEVNGETAYEIRVVNQGSKAATDVVLQAMLPPELKALSAEGPTQHVIQNGAVIFDKLPRLAPKADTTYRIRVQGLAPGDLRMRVQVMTNEITTPVSKEESTRVYSDE